MVPCGNSDRILRQGKYYEEKRPRSRRLQVHGKNIEYARMLLKLTRKSAMYVAFDLLGRCVLKYVRMPMLRGV